MGLFFRILPDKILTFKGENCSGGRAKNPRCFKNVRTLPCACHANSNPWMTMRMLEWNEGFWDTFYECWMTKCGR
ncbi:Tigger transposable element-derived protein 6 [Trichinella papuae]|uniref:Tigger transposable element-derived protein 6 n=1 Tax=Trichinella papuae TaxID=268474 RepID=A0A0V1M3X9_9BILA|nr:Tigger transposable element-derived protein 6 [Trichinella papuae]